MHVQAGIPFQSIERTVLAKMTKRGGFLRGLRKALFGPGGQDRDVHSVPRKPDCSCGYKPRGCLSDTHQCCCSYRSYRAACRAAEHQCVCPSGDNCRARSHRCICRDRAFWLVQPDFPLELLDNCPASTHECVCVVSHPTSNCRATDHVCVCEKGFQKCRSAYKHKYSKDKPRLRRYAESSSFFD